MSSESVEGAEKVQALLIFSLAEEWKQVLLTHGCTFGVYEEYGETIQFPEGTTRTLLYSREGRPTNRYRIQLSDGLEIREMLDDEGTGKSWLVLVLSQGDHSLTLRNARSKDTLCNGNQRSYA